MTPLKVCVIGNLSDRRCGFQNVTAQMGTALRRAGHAVLMFDGTYSEVYRRRESGIESFFPPDILQYDIVHLIWHSMTMNHYNGADWAGLQAGPLVSWWDGGPSNTYCPFQEWMQIKWIEYPKSGYHLLPYPVPDWVTDLPEPDPVFTVGASSIRGDGIAELRQVCEQQGWAMNLPTPGVWVSVEDEIRRLARSTVNVCWYDTPPIWQARASAPSMLIAAGRPLLINHDRLLEHLWDAPDLYHGQRTSPDLATCLLTLATHAGPLRRPIQTAQDLSWTRAVRTLETVWQEALACRT